MPTGYTEKIKDGISFKEFALDCARAFGACVLLRDEPGGGEAIPEKFEPSDYHVKALAEAEKELARIDDMTTSEREASAEAEHNQAERYRKNRLKEKRELKAKYLAMLREVDSWEPPTSDHAELKAFMQKQIKESIDWDCGPDFYSKPTVLLSGEDWAAEKRQKALKSINYHTTANIEEIQRTENRNTWIQALRESLSKTV